MPGALATRVSGWHPRLPDAVGSGEDMSFSDQSAPAGVPPFAVPEVLQRDLQKGHMSALQGAPGGFLVLKSLFLILLVTCVLDRGWCSGDLS